MPGANDFCFLSCHEKGYECLLLLLFIHGKQGDSDGNKGRMKKNLGSDFFPEGIANTNTCKVGCFPHTFHVLSTA